MTDSIIRTEAYAATLITLIVWGLYSLGLFKSAMYSTAATQIRTSRLMLAAVLTFPVAAGVGFATSAAVTFFLDRYGLAVDLVVPVVACIAIPVGALAVAWVASRVLRLRFAQALILTLWNTAMLEFFYVGIRHVLMA